LEVKKLPAAFYCSAARNEPVREWLQSLESTDRRIIGQDIATAEFGWPIGMPVGRVYQEDAKNSASRSGSGAKARKEVT
jgi:hypothetical protein